MFKRIATVLALAVLGTLVAPVAAQAVPDPGGGGGTGCYATGCDGKSPFDTGCVNDMIIMLGMRLNIGSGGYVELHYSPKCRAGWAYTSWRSPLSIYVKSTYLTAPYAIRRYEGAVTQGEYRTTKMVSTTVGTEVCAHNLNYCGYRETTQL